MSRHFRFALPFVLLAAAWTPLAQAQLPVPDLEKEIRQRAAAIESKLMYGGATSTNIQNWANRKRARPRSLPLTSPASALK